jgi:hypothetical protein
MSYQKVKKFDGITRYWIMYSTLEIAQLIDDIAAWTEATSGKRVCKVGFSIRDALMVKCTNSKKGFVIECSRCSCYDPKLRDKYVWLSYFCGKPMSLQT